MKIFKFLDIDRQLQEIITNKMYDYVCTHTNILSIPQVSFEYIKNIDELTEYNKEFVSFLKENSFPSIDTIAIVIFYPGTKYYPHVDNTHRRFRILWPLKNCEGSYTKFYDIPESAFTVRPVPGGTTAKSVIEKKDYPVISEIELTRPVVFDSHVPHAVYPNQSILSPRLTFTVSFNESISYMLA
jgi:hypothetical protein